MANTKLLRRLIRSGAEGDVEAFRGTAKAVIAEERQKHHHLLANDLETILYGHPRAPASPAVRKLTGDIPQDRERGLPLLAVREPVRGLEDIVLSPANRTLVEELLREQNREEVLLAHGLRPSDRVLLCGPPGCGKTLTAEVIAFELGCPLAIVRTDSVVSSFLGETAANLRKVFDFITAHPLVALFDEFDALGKEREDPSEHGELRRVVNAVLQMLDAYSGRSILVAATNHDGMLDSAVWRRFEEVLFLRPPTAAQVRRLLSVKLRGVRYDFDIKEVVERGWFADATHADVERVVRRAVKAMVLEEPVTERRPRRGFPSTGPPGDPRRHATELRERLQAARDAAATEDLGGYDERRLIKITLADKVQPEDVARAAGNVQVVELAAERIQRHGQTRDVPALVGLPAPVQAPGRTDAGLAAQEQPDVAGGRLDQDALADVLVTAHPHPTHTTRLIHVRESTLHHLAPPALQATTPPPAHTPAVRIQRSGLNRHGGRRSVDPSPLTRPARSSDRRSSS